MPARLIRPTIAVLLLTALTAAQRRPEPDQVDALLGALDAVADAPEYERIAPVQALITVHHPRLRDRLLAEWPRAEGMHLREALIHAMQVYPGEDVVRICAEVLEAARDPDETLRFAALALARDAERSATKLLDLATSGQPRQRRAAQFALLLESRHAPELRDLVLEHLPSAPPRAQAGLVNVLAAAEPTDAIRDWLDRHVDHSDAAVRIRVLMAKAVFDGELSRADRERLTALLDADDRPSDPESRAALALAVAAQRKHRDPQAFAAVLGGDRDTWNQLTFRVPTPKSNLAKFCEDELSGSRAPALRRLGLDLAWRDHTERRDAALDDRDPSVVLHALRSRNPTGLETEIPARFAARLHRVLAMTRDRPAIERAGLATLLRAEHLAIDARAAAVWERTLLDWLDDEEAVFVVAALQAVRRLGLTAAAPAAAALLHHDDPVVRRAAVDCLARVPHADALRPLLALYEADRGRIAVDAHAVLATITGRRYARPEHYRTMLDSPRDITLTAAEAGTLSAVPGRSPRRIGEAELHAARICIVLDRSRSMADIHGFDTGTILDAARALVRDFVTVDRPDVALELIAVGDRPESVFGELRTLDTTARQTILDRLDRLEPAGGCNLHDAVQQALALADIEAVVLILGGPANAGAVTLAEHLAHRFDTWNLRTQARLIVLRPDWRVELPNMLADDGTRAVFF